MATKPKTSLGVVYEFLSSETKTIKNATREELAALDAELDKDDWMKDMVVTELKGRIGG